MSRHASKLFKTVRLFGAVLYVCMCVCVPLACVLAAGMERIEEWKNLAEFLPEDASGGSSLHICHAGMYWIVKLSGESTEGQGCSVHQQVRASYVVLRGCLRAGHGLGWRGTGQTGATLGAP